MSRVKRCLSPRYWSVVLIAAVAITLSGSPPNYVGFGRDQVLDYQPNPAKLLRIWCIYIGQGDSLLIQFPPSANVGAERQEMLIDGGPSGNQLIAFLKALLPQPAVIENVVLTHHDADHVKGLSALLNTNGFRVGNFFHNGLASWGHNSPPFPGTAWPPSSAAITRDDRGMAKLHGGGPDIETSDLIVDRARAATAKAGFVAEYKDLVDAATASPGVARFDRATIGDARLAAAAPAGIRITSLWPPVQPRGYGLALSNRPDWSHTINGNSVVFRLDYGEFSMLFTGDLNEASEEQLLQTLGAAGRLPELHTDVLKIPHHGSSHGVKEFFDRVSPVIGVASMGSGGFMTGWKHPSTEVIRWLGGFNRVYSTYIHERAFDYETLTKQGRKDMVETKHVLIETDGIRFRIVEVEDVAHIPDVHAVSRGDGTRWIDAKGGN